MSEMLDWQLVYGPLPAVLTALAAVAGLSLLIRRDRRWWLRVVPFVAGTSVLGTFLLVWIMDDLWRPFPDKLPLRVAYWTGAVLFAVGLAVAGMPKTRWWRRSAAVVAVLVVLATAVMKINAVYGYYPNLRAALGLPLKNEVAFASVSAPVNAPQPLSEWQPPVNMPAKGVVTQTAIPSPTFPARNAYLYLPPAYQVNPRPLLPMLILLAGQPSAPVDWVNGGGIADIMDQFAATHHGVAPIVVMPDATGGGLNNPLCADTKVGGMSETYLTKDVPTWLKANLQVRPDRWAIAGLSYGGTCAIQLALRHPDVLPSFIDMSGQSEPTLGSRAQTVRDLFGGDENAFRQINPADLLATHKYPDSAGVITVGRSDREYGQQQRKMLELCQHNGLDVTWHEVPGAHNWQAWTGGLQASLDWLAKRMELVS